MSRNRGIWKVGGNARAAQRILRRRCAKRESRPVDAAQDNYEIQVYGAQTVAPRTTMFELHSNFTFDGQKNSVNGLFPTNHAEHETLEIAQGINDWMEVGFYVFTSERGGQGVQWVGDHIRPRVRVPDSWGWPLGVSLCTEVGYQRSQFSEDT